MKNKLKGMDSRLSYDSLPVTEAIARVLVNVRMQGSFDFPERMKIDGGLFINYYYNYLLFPFSMPDTRTRVSNAARGCQGGSK